MHAYMQELLKHSSVVGHYKLQWTAQRRGLPLIRSGLSFSMSQIFSSLTNVMGASPNTTNGGPGFHQHPGKDNKLANSCSQGNATEVYTSYQRCRI